jgi:uncharacterized membrane protein YcfT
MVWSNVRFCSVLEVTVLLFQVFGVATLCLNRLLPATRWAAHSRIGSIIALVGLAVAGAFCGRHGSEFGLFAGGTMTVLLIGMTVGNGSGPNDSEVETRRLIGPEPNLAG